jgi:hypothetical protein
MKVNGTVLPKRFTRVFKKPTKITIQTRDSGIGVITDFAVANPAAGAEWTFTVPVGTWSVVEIFTTLTTDATVSSRFAGISITNSLLAILFKAWVNVVQAASIVGLYNFAPGLPSTNASIGAALRVTFPIPTPTIVKGGDVISSASLFGGAADQYTATSIRLQRIGSAAFVQLGHDQASASQSDDGLQLTGFNTANNFPPFSIWWQGELWYSTSVDNTVFVIEINEATS